MCLACSSYLLADVWGFWGSVLRFELNKEVEREGRSFLTDGTGGFGFAAERVCF